jgi:hypothetical protein
MERMEIIGFVSYSHKDDIYVKLLIEGLKSHINPSKRIKWSIWDDRQIQTGLSWHESIQKQVNECDFAILLISSNFFSSEYIEEHEFDKLIKKKEDADSVLFPILIKPCNFTKWKKLCEKQIYSVKGRDFGCPDIEDFTYSDLVSFDKHGLPLPNPNRDRYHKNLAEALESAIENRHSKSIKPEVNSMVKDTDIYKYASNPHYIYDLEKLEGDWRIESVINKNSILIIVGTWVMAELLDRPPAEILRSEIDRQGNFKEGKRAIIITDIEFNKNFLTSEYTLLSVGGPYSNAVTKDIIENADKRLDFSEVFWAFRNNENRKEIALWGNTSYTTRKAVENYINNKESGLKSLITSLWNI